MLVSVLAWKLEYRAYRIGYHQANNRAETNGTYLSRVTANDRSRDSVDTISVQVSQSKTYRFTEHRSSSTNANKLPTMNIVLIGDSIFDNAPYVQPGTTVSDQLKAISDDSTVTLLAVDGDVTTDVERQLNALPANATHLFVSCGGNDALQCLPALEQTVNTVGEAMDVFHELTEAFRENYCSMLSAILSMNKNLTVCTIYNRVPDLSGREKTALSVFNEIILEEAMRHELPILDLRILCDSAEDYAAVSPIEPSEQGGAKIAALIWSVASGRGQERAVAFYK